MNRLEEIKRRCEAATDGPWELTDANEGMKNLVASGNVIVTSRLYRCLPYGLEDDYDSEFIAHSREDLPWVIDMLEEAISELNSREGTGWRKPAWDWYKELENRIQHYKNVSVPADQAEKKKKN